MKSFILDGSDKNNPVSADVNRCLLSLLEREESSVTHIKLAEHDIQGCMGCLGCFFKTPGQCVFNDLARELPLRYTACDLAVFITPVTFGGYSSLFARAFDRMMIQLESHLAETVNGVMRRKKRYGQKPPVLMVIGLEKKPDPEMEKIFTSLVDSNAFVHLQAPKHSVAFISSDQTVDDMGRELTQSLASIRS